MTTLHVMAPPLVSKEAFLGVIWAGTSFGTLALTFRYYVRTKYFHRLFIDDYFAGFAWILLVSTAILWTVIIDDLYEVKHVLSGEKVYDAGFPRSLLRYLHGSLVVLLFFYLTLWTIKINFLVFFYRLGHQIREYRIYWWCVTVFTIAAGATCVGTIQYNCLAVSIEESMTRCSGGSAVRFENITLKVNCALDVLTDALIMSMPISILWKVRMSFTRKLQLAGVFSLVIITMVTSIIRVSVVSSALSNEHQVEITWLYMWHFVESSIALLVACLASFRTLFAVKERRTQEEERYESEQALRESGSRRRAIWARARQLQDSLFDTIKSNSTATKSINELDGMDHPLRDVQQAKPSIDTEYAGTRLVQNSATSTTES